MSRIDWRRSAYQTCIRDRGAISIIDEAEFGGGPIILSCRGTCGHHRRRRVSPIPGLVRAASPIRHPQVALPGALELSAKE